MNREQTRTAEDERDAVEIAGWEREVIARLKHRIEQLDALPEEHDAGWEQVTLTILRERLARDGAEQH
jgi:hypothetical protein